MKIEGYSSKAIADELNKLGVQTPGGAIRKAKVLILQQALLAIKVNGRPR